MNSRERASNSQAGNCLPAMRLEVRCTGFAYTPLARKLNDDAGLGALWGVRMVCMGFRALKTPEEHPNCRRFSVGGISAAKPAEEQNKLDALQEQLRDKTGTDSVRNECSSRAQWRAI
jgi:hypothetical protein